MKSTLMLLSLVFLFSTGRIEAQLPFLVIQPGQNSIQQVQKDHQKPAQDIKKIKSKSSFLQEIAAAFHPPFAKGCKTDGFGLTAFILGFASLALPPIPGIIVLGITLILALASLIRISQRSCRNSKSGSNGKPLLKGRGFAYVAIIGTVFVLGLLLLGTIIL